MRTQQTFSQDFDEIYNQYHQNPTGKSLLDIEGISRDCLDVGVMSRQYFTERLSDISLDANSNSNDELSQNNYSSEIVKGLSKLNSYYLLYHYAKERYDQDKANDLLSSILSGNIYFHDATSVQIPYCMAYSTSFIMNEGRKYGQLYSLPPKRANSFLAQVTETTMDLSQSYAGAIAISDLIVNFCYYAKKEHLSNYDIINLLQQFIHVMNNKFRVGGQCVDEFTEVLTPNGFKKYDELSIGDLIYTWKNGSLNIEPIQKINIYEYNGPMHLYKGRDIIQQVTPNHLVLHMKNNYKSLGFNQNNKYKLSSSNDLITKKTSLQIPVATEYFDRPDYNISDELIQLAVIILTDGTIETIGNHKHAHIYKSPKRYGNKLIQKLLNILGIKYNVKEKQDRVFLGGTIMEYYINLSSISETIRNLDKNHIPEWAFLLSRRQSKLFIDTWALFDGQTIPSQYNKQKLQCDNIEIANSIQHICVLAGLGSHLLSEVVNKNKTPTIYVLPYNRTIKSCYRKEIVEYNGITWCPTTTAGVVIYRKEGKVFISGNSPFTNLSIFDRPNLEKLFSHLTYPDGSSIDIEYVIEVQKLFAEWFAKGDPVSGMPYRFPVITINLSCDNNKKIIDQEFLKWVSEINTPKGTFNIYINSGNKIASCCRLINDGSRMPARVDSFGNGGLNLGSHRVVTINLPRVAMQSEKSLERFYSILSTRLEECRDLLQIHRDEILKRRIDQGFLRFYKPLGWFSLSRMFSTIGIIGIYEMCYFMDQDIHQESGQKFVIDVLTFIEDFAIKTSKETGNSFNVEEIPGESVATKFVQKDKVLFGPEKIPFELYSNQYIPLIENISLPERISITGHFQDLLSGGGILHLNLQEKIEDPTIMQHLIEYAVSKGVSHLAVNYSFGLCENNHTTISGNLENCPFCGKKIVSHLTRIVGYFTETTSWNKIRREYEFPNRVFS